MDVSLLGAFLGGVLTLLSPCSVMLLPAFFAFAFGSVGLLAGRIGLFYLGLVTTLVPLGLLAGTFGSWLTADRERVVQVAAGVLAVLGLMMVAGIGIPGLSRSGPVQGTSALSVYVLGTVYGFAGACTGPLLGAVLAAAAISGNALRGGLLLLVFAAGMTLPLLVLAGLWHRVPAVRALVRPREIRVGRWRNTWTQVVGGVITLGIAVLLLLSDGTTALSGLLGATRQFEIESKVRVWSDSVPDWLTAGVALALLGGAVWWVRRRGRASTGHTGGGASVPSAPPATSPGDSS